MYYKNSKGEWEHNVAEYTTVIVGNNWEANFDFLSYFSRNLNNATQYLYYERKLCILHPGDTLHLYEYAKNNDNFYFTIGKFIGWSRNLEDLSLDIKGNLERGAVHVVHFIRKGNGSKTVVTFTELPIEEYSNYGKETNE
jgi:hypothetical protein